MRPTGRADPVVWLIGAQVVGLGSILAGTRVLTELVPPAAYGVFSLCLLINLLVGNALGQGVVQGAIARVAAGGRTPRSAWPRFVLAGLAAAIVGAAAGLAFAGRFGAWWPLLPICAAWIAADLRLRLSLGVLNALSRHRAYAVWSALAPPAQLWGSIGAVLLLSPDLVPLALGGCAGTVAMATIQRLVLGPPAGEAGTEEPPAALLAMVPATILAWMLTSAERYLIAGLISVEAAGIYAAGYALVTRPIMVFSISVALPIIRPAYYRLAAEDPAAGRRHLARRAGVAAAAIALGVVLLTCLLPWVLPLVLAPAYHGCARIIPWLGGAYLLWSLTQFAELPYFRAGRMPSLLPRYAGGAAIGAVAVSGGAIADGLVGAAIGVGLGMAATLALLAWRSP